MKHITYGTESAHARSLVRGLSRMGPGFVAELCWWCDGTGTRKYEHCSVCGSGKPYGTALGLLVCNKPAPDSVVNQVLVAADEDATTPRQ